MPIWARMILPAMKIFTRGPRVRAHNKNRIVAARAIADMKTFGHLSLRKYSCLFTFITMGVWL